MDNNSLAQTWHEKYKIVPEQFAKTAQINSAATGFNTNIDAVTKISGKKISELAAEYGVSLSDIKNCPAISDSPKAVICGIIKCFVGGIAEEWLTSSVAIDEWIEQNIHTERMQMGGQAGIIANVLALTEAQKILVNTASHPETLSAQFIADNRLLAADENSELVPAHTISRPHDVPLVHRIIEFDKGDTLTLSEQELTCPKSNRFIATYDPLNAKMQINKAFADFLLTKGFDYFIFSGYSLLSGADGLIGAEKSAEFLQSLKQKCPDGITHLEIASTQDKQIRRYMLEKIALLSTSLGLNERETLDVCEVLFPEVWQKLNKEKLNAVNLFDALVKIKKFTKVKRLQLHIFGLYVCLQDKDYKFTPKQSLKGMLCASVAAASKASLGYLQKPQDLTSALKTNGAKIHFAELQALAEYLNAPTLLSDGTAEYENFDLIATPTMLVESPKTLVGMGDTISSLSLICAR